MVFPVKNRKNEHHHQSECITFSFKYQISVERNSFGFFLPYLSKNVISGLTQKKWTPPSNWTYLNLGVGVKVQVKQTILSFWTKFDQNSISGDKQKKMGDIRINVGTKSQLKQTTFNFLDLICSKRVFLV